MKKTEYLLVMSFGNLCLCIWIFWMIDCTYLGLPLIPLLFPSTFPLLLLFSPFLLLLLIISFSIPPPVWPILLPYSISSSLLPSPPLLSFRYLLFLLLLLLLPFLLSSSSFPSLSPLSPFLLSFSLLLSFSPTTILFCIPAIIPPCFVFPAFSSVHLLYLLELVPFLPSSSFLELP